MKLLKRIVMQTCLIGLMFCKVYVSLTMVLIVWFIWKINQLYYLTKQIHKTFVYTKNTYTSLTMKSCYKKYDICHANQNNYKAKQVEN